MLSICSDVKVTRDYSDNLVFGAFFTLWTSRGYFLHWIELSL